MPSKKNMGEESTGKKDNNPLKDVSTRTPTTVLKHSYDPAKRIFDKKKGEKHDGT